MTDAQLEYALIAARRAVSASEREEARLRAIGEYLDARDARLETDALKRALAGLEAKINRNSGSACSPINGERGASSAREGSV